MVRNGIYWTCRRDFLRGVREDVVDTFERCMNRYQIVPYHEMLQYDDNLRYEMRGKDSYGRKTSCGFRILESLGLNDFAMFTFINDRPVSKAQMSVVLSGSDDRPPGIEINYLCADSSDFSSAGSNMIKNAIEMTRCVSNALMELDGSRTPQVSLFSANDTFYDRHTPLERIAEGSQTYAGGQRGSRATNAWLRSVRPVSTRQEVIDLTEEVPPFWDEELPDDQSRLTSSQLREKYGGGFRKAGKGARHAAASMWCS